MLDIKCIILPFIVLAIINSNETNCEILRDAKDLAHLVPYPQQIVSYATQLTIDSNNFKFVTKTKQKCDLLDDAIKRYRKLAFINGCYNLHNENKSPFESIELNPNEDYLTNITIEVKGDCVDQWPHLHMDEMYTLRIDTQDFPKQAFLFANTIWGALRGLETFSQLIQHKSDNTFAINSTFIVDFPRFTYRGVLIDTSRHFLPIHVIHENLEAMSYYKMNVLHWHIVDDQSFPYVSQEFPELSSKGSYNPKTHVYSAEDIKNVIEFARYRGIRVIVEFDTPSHCLSWGKGYPHLLTQCYSGDKPNGQLGAMNPSRNTTFEFLNSLFKEIANRFPDQYIHIGGDEVNTTCWKSNPEIQLFMKDLGISGEYDKLEEYFFKRLIKNISGLNKSWIVWQEVFDRNISIPNNTIVNVWKQNFNTELYELTKLDYEVILSSCWYLNKISYGYDWFQYYTCDPQGFNGTDHQNSLVLGGQASMWGEWVDASNFMTRTWPRAMSVAERLWSPKSLSNATEAQYRFVPNRCRMLERGLRLQPVVEPKEYKFGFCRCDSDV
ncbi:unnamed protein product [Medioppia subpectinata]|uniref:Beta-hexosaminidase n=1 Tax=Medioppia subpectinata TaxID=1979941 RepID=A0A7R9Q8I5_9ACAR|nr:unnamed protein product [Medioppia subpectinata]CAG2115884.1 unnamed protein product [Medioppia subpectinata]